jgi:hypothetical protein
MNEHDIETTIRAVIIEMRGSRILRFKDPRTNLEYAALNEAGSLLLEPKIQAATDQTPKKKDTRIPYERRLCIDCGRKKSYKEFTGDDTLCKECKGKKQLERRRLSPYENPYPELPIGDVTELHTLQIPVNETPSLFEPVTDFGLKKPSQQKPSVSEPQATIKKWPRFRVGKAK